MTKIIFPLLLLIIVSSCRVYVPNIPTLHIPEKAHELNMSAGIGSPTLSLNAAYNPHQNIGIVLAYMNDLDVADVSHEYWESGLAGYWRVSDEVMMSATPTIGFGSMSNPRADQSRFFDTDVISAKEVRTAFLLNSVLTVPVQKTKIKFNFALRLVRSNFDAILKDFNGRLSQKSFDAQFLEPMAKIRFEFDRAAVWGLVGYSGNVGTSDKQFYYPLPYLFLGFGADFTLNLAPKKQTTDKID